MSSELSSQAVKAHHMPNGTFGNPWSTWQVCTRSNIPFWSATEKARLNAYRCRAGNDLLAALDGSVAQEGYTASRCRETYTSGLGSSISISYT